MSNKNFFVVEDHTVTNIGLVQLITQKTGMDCAGVAFSKSEAVEKLKALLPREVFGDNNKLVIGVDYGLQDRGAGYY